MKKVRILIALLLVMVLTLGPGTVGYAAPADQASTVYLGGTVITLDSSNSIAQAVAVKGDKIVAVGTEKEIRALIGKDTKVVDLKGKTLMPGFYDAHSHFSSAGQTALFQVDLNSPPIGKMTSIADYIEALKKKAQETPPGEWIRGRGYDDTLVVEMRHPTRYDLDKVSTEHPIWVVHISGHLGAANSKALEMAGITKDTVPPEGGIIRKDPVTGEPDGVLEETAMGLVSRLIPAFTPEQKQEALAYASKMYAKKGVTTANDGSANSLATIADYQKAVADGRLSTRVVVWVDPAIVEAAHQIDLGTNMLTIGGAKTFQDGSIQGYTGYLSQPYYVPFQGDPTYRGYPRYSREELTDIVKKVHNAGHQIFIHGNGDAAIDDILYAYSEAQKENPRPDARHVVIHAQMAREDQLDLMKELGVIPSFYVLHTYYWGDRHYDIFMGPERALRMSPCKSALDRGIPFTIHCDTPVVPQDPLLLVWSAVNRISTSGRLVGGGQRVKPLEALRAVTINAAYQNFEENIKGSIEPGKLADFVILSENPLTCPPERIRDIQVLETIVGGKTVYKAPVQWLPPMTNTNRVFKYGSALPLKFNLLDEETGALLREEQQVCLAVCGPSGKTIATFNLHDGNEGLRFDGGTYMANFKTQDYNLGAGLYIAKVIKPSTDEVLGSIFFKLSSK